MDYSNINITDILYGPYNDLDKSILEGHALFEGMHDPTDVESILRGENPQQIDLTPAFHDVAIAHFLYQKLVVLKDKMIVYYHLLCMNNAMEWMIENTSPEILMTWMKLIARSKPQCWFGHNEEDVIQLKGWQTFYARYADIVLDA